MVRTFELILGMTNIFSRQTVWSQMAKCLAPTPQVDPCPNLSLTPKTSETSSISPSAQGEPLLVRNGVTTPICTLEN